MGLSRERRVLARITGDATKAVCSKNGKNYEFTPPVEVGRVVDFPGKTGGSVVKDLVAAGVAEKAK